MIGLISAVRGKIGKRADRCCVEKCAADGCRAQIDPDLFPYVLVDMDRFLPAGAESRCDFLLVSNRGNRVAPLELKKGKAHARKTLRQLQAGARVADRLIPKAHPVKFQPVVVSGSIHKHELDLYRKQTVTFRGRDAAVLRIKCGATLSQCVLGGAPAT